MKPQPLAVQVAAALDRLADAVEALRADVADIRAHLGLAPATSRPELLRASRDVAAQIAEHQGGRS